MLLDIQTLSFFWGIQPLHSFREPKCWEVSRLSVARKVSLKTWISTITSFLLTRFFLVFFPGRYHRTSGCNFQPVPVSPVVGADAFEISLNNR